jgi:hypothetical protein
MGLRFSTHFREKVHEQACDAVVCLGISQCLFPSSHLLGLVNQLGAELGARMNVQPEASSTNLDKFWADGTGIEPATCGFQGRCDVLIKVRQCT